VNKMSKELKQVHATLTQGIQNFFEKSGFKKALIGLSGGIDSALVAVLATQALGKENIHGVSMPSCYSSEHSKDDARNLANNLGIRYDTVPIQNCFETLKKTLHPLFGNLPEGLAEENMQSRLRGIILMSISNKFGELVLTTGNKSEIFVGYCTLYGDTCGALAPISKLYKTEVYELSYWINSQYGELIPKSTLTKAPSAELRPNQKDQDSLPPYDQLDAILRLYCDENKTAEEIMKKGYSADIVQRVISLVQKSQHKRSQLAPGISL